MRRLPDGWVDRRGELTDLGEQHAEHRYGNVPEAAADLPTHIYEHLLPWDVPNDGGPVR